MHARARARPPEMESNLGMFVKEVVAMFEPLEFRFLAPRFSDGFTAGARYPHAIIRRREEGLSLPIREHRAHV